MGIEFDPRQYLAKQPEQMFASPTLLHTSAEINSIIEHFSHAERRPSYSAVISLLEVTKRFRMDTSVTGAFARQPGDVKGLDKIFKNMEAALVTADTALEGFAGIDADIVQSAVRYVRASITGRVHQRSTDSAFIECWNQSGLKKMIEATDLKAS